MQDLKLHWFSRSLTGEFLLVGKRTGNKVAVSQSWSGFTRLSSITFSNMTSEVTKFISLSRYCTVLPGI